MALFYMMDLVESFAIRIQIFRIVLLGKNTALYFGLKNSFEKKFSPSFHSSFFDENKCGVHTLVSHPVDIDSETNTTENHIEVTDKKYAVIDIKSKQYKITLDDLIISDRIHDLDIGESYTCNNVMLLGSQNETIIGQPYIENASVTLSCEEQTK